MKDLSIDKINFNKKKLANYIIESFKSKEFLYETNPQLRLSSMYWGVVTLKIIENDIRIDNNFGNESKNDKEKKYIFEFDNKSGKKIQKKIKNENLERSHENKDSIDNKLEGNLDCNFKKDSKNSTLEENHLKNEFINNSKDFDKKIGMEKNKDKNLDQNYKYSDDIHSKINDVYREAEDFLIKCKNDDGGYGGNIGYRSTMFNTFVAMQLSFLLRRLEYDKNTMNFIKNCYRNGIFYNDNYEEEDTKFLCCSLVSLYFQYLAKNNKLYDVDLCRIKENKICNTEFIDYFSDSFCDNEYFSKFLTEEGYDLNEIISYIFKCYNRDGGFGAKPGNESHAGQVFCCIVSLSLLNRLYLLDIERVKRFLVFRHNYGLNGRPNKKDDVCYSYWAYSVYKILDIPINKEKIVNFIFECFNNGFSHAPGKESDLFHTAYATLGLSLLKIKGFKEAIPELGVV